MGSLIEQVSRVRVDAPEQIAARMGERRRPPRVVQPDGRLFLIAADHPARGSLQVADDRVAMGDREDLLARLLVALGRPGVDGLMATADIVEDLCLLGALEGKVVFGSMNRGGLAGAVFELDDGFTGYSVEGIVRACLDGGKMMVRIDDQDPGTLRTLESCARAIDGLAAHRLPAMVEVYAARREGTTTRPLRDPRSLARAISIASALGGTSAFTWLKVPVVDDMGEVLAATSLPTFLLGGDPGADAATVFARWERAMAWPHVRGLVAGRTLLYPANGDVAGAVDRAAAIVSPEQKPPGQET